MGNEQSTALQKVADSHEVSCASLSGIGPSSRETSGAFFTHGNSGALVIIGGHGAAEAGADAEYNDVWALPSGGGWQSCSPSGRAALARSGHTVTSVTGVGLVVFGGLSQEKGYLNDVALLAPVRRVSPRPLAPLPTERSHASKKKRCEKRRLRMVHLSGRRFARPARFLWAATSTPQSRRPSALVLSATADSA